MITLSFKVEKDHLIRCDKEKITDKTRNYIRLSFSSFSEDWDDLNVFLILQDEAKNNYLFDLNEDNPVVTVPEVVLRGGLFKVSVVGFNEDTRITTNRRTIPLFPSGYTTDIQPVEPGDYSTDVFEDFILIGAETVEGNVKDWIPSQLDVAEQVPADEGYGKTYIVSFGGEPVGVKINTPLGGGGGGGVDIVTRWGNSPVDYRVPSERLVKSSLDLKLDSSDAFSGDYNDLSNKPSIPTVPSNISAFTNDVGYLTQHQSLDGKTVTVEKQSSAESGYAHTYVIKQGGTQVGSKINIPKDFLVKSASVKTVTTADTPVQGYVVGDKYLDFVVNSKDNTATDEHLYVLVSELVDTEVDWSNVQNKPSIPSSSSDLSDGSDLVKKSDVVDNLTSTSATAPLSAKQGKVLSDLIGEAISYING